MANTTEEFRQEVKEEFVHDDNSEMVFDALSDILGDDVDGIWAMMDDAEYIGLI